MRVSFPLIPELSNNPYWIAFFKVGACGELASLFSEVSKRAGIETRIVGTKAKTIHGVEIKLNDKWVHVDPTLYYINYQYHQSLKWIDNPRFYDLRWFNISKVVVGNTNEDTTREYTDVGILRIYLDKPANRIIVKTVKDKKEREVTIVEANSLIIDIELGGKRYNIIAEKDLIPYLFVLRDNNRQSWNIFRFYY